MAQTLAATIEPYRMGTSFTDWSARLKFLFIVNKIEDSETKKAHFITLGCPIIYLQLKLLYPTRNFDGISYDDLIKKLCERFDKTESDMIQRLRFNTRNQQPNETLQDRSVCKPNSAGSVNIKT